MEVLLAYVHHVALATTAAALVTMILRCHQDMQPPDVRVLARTDLVYFVAGMMLLASGLARVFIVGKGSAFYLHNPVFYIKMAMFIALGLLSIPTTLQFARWRRALVAGEARVLNGAQITATRTFLLAQAGILSAIPLMAVLMARGFGIQAAQP